MTKHKIFGYSAKCVESRSGDFIKGREYRVVGEGDTGAGGEISILGEEGGVRNVVWRGCLWGFERTESPTAIDQILGTEPDADGWIEWHGGECPVGEGVAIDTMQRGGIQTNNTQKDGRGARLWQHGGYISDIIAYRIHQPEQEEAPMTIEQLLAKASKHAAKAEKHEAKRQALVEQAERMKEDAVKEEIEKMHRIYIEGASGHQGGIKALYDAGYRMVAPDAEQPAEDMNDPANWKAGDVVEFRHQGRTGITKGKEYPIRGMGVANQFVSLLDDDGDARTFTSGSFKWISRPQ